MKKWMMIPVLAGAVILSGVGIVANAEQSKSVVQKGLLTMEEAKAIAVKSIGGNVTKIELDREVSGDVYEVEIQSKGIEYDLDIDAKTGKVLRTEKDDMDNDDQDDNVIPDGKYISEEAAIEIAMKQAKGTVTEIGLDNEDGVVVYEIKITDSTYEYEFEIDATSGKVLKFEQDREDDDDNDND